MTKRKDHLKVGRAQTWPSAPAHIPSVPQGGSKGSIRRQAGTHEKGRMATGSARRSTGINAQDREPIDPRSPNLSPA